LGQALTTRVKFLDASGVGDSLVGVKERNTPSVESNRAEQPLMRLVENAFPGRVAISPQEFAKACDLNPASVYRLVDRQVIKANRSLRHLRIPISEVIHFLAGAS